MEQRPTRSATAGEEEFGRLFDEHSRAIYNYCFRRTAEWAVAEDLMSIVFLEAWRRRAEVDLVTTPALPWLYGVASNVLRNHRRALRRYRAALRRVPAPAPTPDFAEQSLARLDHERRMRALLDAISGLPPGEQDVLALVMWQGLSYEETALAIGVPVGTVRSRLSRARGRIAAEHTRDLELRS